MLVSKELMLPVGSVLLLAEDKEKYGGVLKGLWLKNQKYFGGWYAEKLSGAAGGSLPILEQTEQWLSRYFNGEKPLPEELSLSPDGTAFQKLVWRELLRIPYGETVTYGDLAVDLARQMGKSSMSAQAVGGAVGHNPISIIIPCHRVIGRDGSLTGYAGGLDRKKFLLRLEKGLVTEEPSH